MTAISRAFHHAAARVGSSALALVLCTCHVGAVSGAAAFEPSDDELFDMSLGELLTLKVTSASKRAEPLFRTAAAVFVITQEDIRRSGATTVPEVLRMAPGVQVARLGASTWAISARGFNGRFANKLLVMIDGRSLYSPQFSGVYWDVSSLMLEDIDRIEVIRGPGATLWGANAVNGVINIITKPAGDTQGGTWTGSAGNEERAGSSLRYGGKVGTIGHYRVYGTGYDRDGSLDAATQTDNADDWRGYKAGFRLDLAPTGRDDLALHGNVYQGRHGETVLDQTSLWNSGGTIDLTTDVLGLDLLGHWTRRLSDTDELALKSYYDHSERDWTRFGETLDTLDVELEYRTHRFDRHDLIVGLGYRLTMDRVTNSNQIVVDPEEDSLHLFSTFVQDDLKIVPDSLTLTLGAKLEHNDDTGFEIQPNLRLLWTPAPQQSLWTSVARAVRTPGRGERDAIVRHRVLSPGTAMNPSQTPIEVAVIGNPDQVSEDLVAYEIGYKWQAARSLTLDLALFHNEYDSLRSSTQGQILCLPRGVYPDCLAGNGTVTSLLVPWNLDNEASGSADGVELAADWRPLKNWRLQAAYTNFESRFSSTDGYAESELLRANPVNQFSLRSWFNPRDDVDVDVWLRFTDEISALIAFEDFRVDPYWELDARLAWRPVKRLELSLVGQNLLNDAHVEGFSELGDMSLASVERSLYVRVRMDF